MWWHHEVHAQAHAHCPCPDDRPPEFGPFDCCLMQAENLLIEINAVLTLAFTRFSLRERCTRPMWAIGRHSQCICSIHSVYWLSSLNSLSTLEAKLHVIDRKLVGLTAILFDWFCNSHVLQSIQCSCCKSATASVYSKNAPTKFVIKIWLLRFVGCFKVLPPRNHSFACVDAA